MSFRYQASSVSGFATAANFQGFPSEPLGDLSHCRLFTFRKQQSTLDLTSQDPVLCPEIFVPHQEFLIDPSGDVGHHARPKHLGFPLNLQPRESKILDAVFQSEKSIRGEPVESCKLAGILSGKLYLAAYAQRLSATGLTFYDDEVIQFFSPHAHDKGVIMLVAVGNNAKFAQA